MLVRWVRTGSNETRTDHEAEERRDNDGNALVDASRELKAQALAEGSCSLDENIATLKSGGDDLALMRPKRGLVKLTA